MFFSGFITGFFIFVLSLLMGAALLHNTDYSRFGNEAYNQLKATLYYLCWPVTMWRNKNRITGFHMPAKRLGEVYKEAKKVTDSKSYKLKSEEQPEQIKEIFDNPIITSDSLVDDGDFNGGP